MTERKPPGTSWESWIEAQIRRNPAQYLWVHKRFKTRPEGQPGLYGPQPR